LERGTAFEDIERAVYELEPEVVPALHIISMESAGAAGGKGSAGRSIPSLRFRDDAVVALIDNVAGVSITGGMLVAHDPLTGLAVLRTDSSPLPSIRTWTLQAIEYPRYVLVSDVSQGRVSLHPIFLGHLSTAPNSAWSADVWRMSSFETVPNGAFVFTTSGALAGLVIGEPDNPAIVPAETVISTAERLVSEDQKKPAGRLGIEVQPLTSQIRAATGLTSGAVVTWVDPQGPAAGKIIATDIIEAAGDQGIQTKADWEAYAARMTARDTVRLRIWRNGRTEQLQVTALELGPTAVSTRLGLTMRVRSGVGAEVLNVEKGSVAMRAGIEIGDVLTRVGEIAAPTPAQITETFAAATKDRALLVAITRGTGHFVAALVKQ
jgi:S1-C subfamily serine protease